MKVIQVSEDRFLSEFPNTGETPKQATFFMEDDMGLGWIRNDETFEIEFKKRKPKKDIPIESGDDLKLLIALSSTDYDKESTIAVKNATKHFTEILAQETLENEKAKDLYERYDEITSYPKSYTNIFLISTMILLLLLGITFYITNIYLK